MSLRNEQGHEQGLSPTLQGEGPFPAVHLSDVTHQPAVSAQSDQGASWQSKECPKGRHLA